MQLITFVFSSFWYFVGSLILTYVFFYFIINGIIRIISRFLRAIMILSRGWPPQHLDADGDPILITKKDIGTLN